MKGKQPIDQLITIYVSIILSIKLSIYRYNNQSTDQQISQHTCINQSIKLHVPINQYACIATN